MLLKDTALSVGGQTVKEENMNYIVSVEWDDKKSKWHEEYRKFNDLEDAKRFADEKATELEEQEKNNKIGGFCVLIYEVTNY